MKLNITYAVFIAVLSMAIFVFGNMADFDLETSLAVGLIAVLWCLSYMYLSDILCSRHRAFVYLKKFIIVAVTFVCFVNLLSVSLTGSTVRKLYLRAIVQKNFINHSGVSNIEASVIVIIVIGMLAAIALIASRLNVENRARPRPVVIAVLLLLLVVDQSAGAYFSFTGSNVPGRIFSAMPWRPYLTTASILREFKGNAPRGLVTNPSVAVEDVKAKTTPLPNIVFIVADSVRADMLGGETMPYLSAQPGLVSSNNYSNGNCTHMGIFSALSGLFPTYYANAMEQQYTPFLLRFAKENGYSMSLISSNDMDWMGLGNLMGRGGFGEYIITGRQNRGEPDLSFLRYIDKEELRRSLSVTKERDGALYENVMSELDTVRRFRELLEARDSGKPAFYFLLFDAAHYEYRYPEPMYTHFTPSAAYDGPFTTANYYLARDKYFNRYKNAVRFVDDLTREVFEILKRDAMFDDSLIILIGDHGEEFLEHGSIFHSGNPSREQLSAALYLKLPGVASAERMDAVTTHLDIVPTVADYFDVKLPEGFRGASLLEGGQGPRYQFGSQCGGRNPERFVVLEEHGTREISLLKGVKYGDDARGAFLQTAR